VGKESASYTFERRLSQLQKSASGDLIKGIAKRKVERLTEMIHDYSEDL
jgi:hypothetical protein